MTFRTLPLVAMTAAAFALAACQDDSSESGTETDTGAGTEESSSEESSMMTTPEADTDVASNSASGEMQQGTDVGAASSDATQTAQSAAADGGAPAPAAREEARAAAEDQGTVGDVAGDSQLSQVLSVDGFDKSAIVTRIERSQMDQAQKAALTTAVNSVDTSNEVGLEALIERLRIAFDAQAI